MEKSSCTERGGKTHIKITIFLIKFKNLSYNQANGRQALKCAKKEKYGRYGKWAIVDLKIAFSTSLKFDSFIYWNSEQFLWVVNIFAEIWVLEK